MREWLGSPNQTKPPPGNCIASRTRKTKLINYRAKPYENKVNDMTKLQTTALIAATSGLMSLVALGYPPATATPADEQAAVTAAKTWLALVDKGQIGQAWDSSASFLKSAAPKQQFVNQVKPIRDAFGKVLSRTLKGKQFTKTVPGAPDGEYVIIQFDTTFEKKKDAVETITPMKDKGQWRVSGYFIK